MTLKKYTWIIGLLALIQTTAFAQQGSSTADWWKDSSKVATKNMPQFNEFMNNQYSYPAKPRSMWELGFHAGLPMIFGDVDNRLGYGGGLSLRKALGHVFSLRADYTGGFAYGLDYRTRTAGVDPGSQIWGAPGTQYVPNYRARLHQGSLDLIASLNNISHYRGNPKSDWYVLAGYSLIGYDVDVDGTTSGANLTGIDFSASRQDIKTALKDKMNGEYNLHYPSSARNDVVGNGADWSLRHAFSFGGGVSFKLTPRLSLGIEERITMPFYDQLDAVHAGISNDFLSYTSIRGGFALGNAAKKVAPLWWSNPNNYVYNELNVPQHMKFPKSDLPDTDRDGVADQFDLEPNSPAGANVDSRGRSMDTDKDGVPDYKDKELLTPQAWFPVSAEGVGSIKEPACCEELRNLLKQQPQRFSNNDCNMGGLPSIQFANGSNTLNANAQALLTGAAAQIKANPNCKVKCIGYAANDKRAQQLSWERVNAVIRYLIDRQGISESRFIFTYGENASGSNNTVDLQATTESGPNTVLPPHPHLRQTK